VVNDADFKLAPLNQALHLEFQMGTIMGTIHKWKKNSGKHHGGKVFNDKHFPPQYFIKHH